MYIPVIFFIIVESTGERRIHRFGGRQDEALDNVEMKIDKDSKLKSNTGKKEKKLNEGISIGVNYL
jgi:hypothetical protein